MDMLEALLLGDTVLELPQVDVQDLRPIDLHADLAPLRGDVEVIPFSDRFGDVLLLWRYHVPNAAGTVLPGPALGPVLIDELDLRPLEAGVHIERAANGDASVSALAHLDLQAQFKIGILFLGHQPAAAAAHGEDRAVV